MTRFIIFAIISLLVFAYATPEDIVRQIPYGPDVRSTVISIADRARVAVGDLANNDFVKQIIRQLKLEAVKGMDGAKTDLKDSLKQEANRQIDEGVDRVIPTPSP